MGDTRLHGEEVLAARVRADRRAQARAAYNATGAEAEVARVRLREVFRGRTRAEWEALLGGPETCFAPVLSVAEAMDDPHMQARGLVTEVDVDGRPSASSRRRSTGSARACTRARRGSASTPTRCSRRSVAAPPRSPACGSGRWCDAALPRRTRAHGAGATRARRGAQRRPSGAPARRRDGLYAGIHDDSRRLAAGLAELGVRHGDHVAILLDNTLDFHRVWFGVNQLGAVGPGQYGVPRRRPAIRAGALRGRLPRGRGYPRRARARDRGRPDASAPSRRTRRAGTPGGRLAVSALTDLLTADAASAPEPLILPPTPQRSCTRRARRARRRA